MSDEWLDDEVTPEKARKDQQAQALEFAKLYEVFVADPRAKKLLEHWVETIESRDVPADASHATYAFYEGRRQFVRGIQRQIQFAATEGKT